MGYGILERVSLFFFILVLLSVFHDFLSLSVSESFAFVTGEGLGFPGAKGVVLIKRTAVELFNISLIRWSCIILLVSSAILYPPIMGMM